MPKAKTPKQPATVAELYHAYRQADARSDRMAERHHTDSSAVQDADARASRAYSKLVGTKPKSYADLAHQYTAFMQYDFHQEDCEVAARLAGWFMELQAHEAAMARVCKKIESSNRMAATWEQVADGRRAEGASAEDVDGLLRWARDCRKDAKKLRAELTKLEAAGA